MKNQRTEQMYYCPLTVYLEIHFVSIEQKIWATLYSNVIFYVLFHLQLDNYIIIIVIVLVIVILIVIVKVTVIVIVKSIVVLVVVTLILVLVVILVLAINN